MNPLGLVKAFDAEGVIPQRRIIGYGATEGTAKVAAPDSKLLGTSGIRGAAAAGKRVDVYMSDIQDVEFGAAVAYGDWLTADADGKAIPASPASGVTVEVVGRAQEAGGAGTIGKVHVNVQTITG